MSKKIGLKKFEKNSSKKNLTKKSSKKNSSKKFVKKFIKKLVKKIRQKKFVKKKKETERNREKLKLTKRTTSFRITTKQHKSRFLEAPFIQQADGDLKFFLIEMKHFIACFVHFDS